MQAVLEDLQLHAAHPNLYIPSLLTSLKSAEVAVVRVRLLDVVATPLRVRIHATSSWREKIEITKRELVLQAFILVKRMTDATACWGKPYACR